jgi:hypothetical protein
LSPSEIISASDNHSHLSACSHHVSDLPSDGGHDVRINTKSTTASKGFTAEFEKDALPATLRN